MTDTLVDIDPDLRELVVNAPGRRGRDPARWSTTPGPGLGSLVRNLDILNKVTIPRLDGVEQMLVTYPDVVSGGFTVVRNDSGVMRAHFGFVLNSDDPHACISRLPVDRRRRRSPGAVATTDTRSVACDVINGVDPNPGDGVRTRAGPTSAGEQNIGRSGGVGGTGPQSGGRRRGTRVAGDAARRPARRPAARQPLRPHGGLIAACRRPTSTRRQGEFRW